MSVDISPDGQTIVFDLLGDLYSMASHGGRARRLTSGLAFNSQPRYSPDGRRLVFISDRSGAQNIWVADTNGSNARQLSQLSGYLFDAAVASPDWSPDGRTIIASQKVGATARSTSASPSQATRWLLVGYDVPTGHMRWISDTAASLSRSALGATYSPEADALYASIEPHDQGIALGNEYQIARIDLETGRPELALGLQLGRAGLRPAVSPNGRYLAYVSSSGSHQGLRVHDLRTEREWWLVREMLDDPPYGIGGFRSGELVPGYAFTPDSKSVILAYRGRIHRVQITTGVSQVIPFTVEVERKLGALEVHQFVLPDTGLRTRAVMQPALSPSGQFVAFSSMNRIWIMRLPQDSEPGGQPWRLTADSVGEFFPSWSPDGQWIVYSAWEDGIGGSVRRARVSPEGTSALNDRLTTEPAIYLNTAVSADGQRVAAVQGKLAPERLLTNGVLYPSTTPALTPTLVWIPWAGGRPRTVTRLVGYVTLRYPVDQLYTTSDRDRIYVGLKSWRFDGSDERTELRAPEPVDTFHRSDLAGVLSADGDRGLVTHNNALYEVKLPSQIQQPAGGRIFELGAAPTAFGSPNGAAHRWGTAILPWISWSRDGRRVIFVQGGTLFIGDVWRDRWIAFRRMDVPLSVPVDIPLGTVVLHGARLITMSGSEVIARGDLVIRHNRIVGLGPVGRVPVPAGARIFDVTGKTVLPGYVDVHDHVQSQLPVGAHPSQAWPALVRLAYGITALRDPAAEPDGAASEIFAYREQERMGALIAPRIFSSGLALHVTEPDIQTLGDAREVVRPYADYFKTETYKEYIIDAGRRSRQLIEVAVLEAGLNATVEGAANAFRDETVLIDGFSGLEHSLPIRFYSDVATLIARSGTTHTQTIGAMTYSWRYMYRRFGSPLTLARWLRLTPPSVRKAASCGFCPYQAFDGGRLDLSRLVPLLRGAALIVARGGRVAIGSHGDVPGVGFHYEMWLHALGGMSNHDILRSATIAGATAIGHAQDFGSLEPGKLADLQVLDKNPLEDIRNTISIRYVMKNGRLYKAHDLTEVWPRQRPLPRIYIWPDSVAPIFSPADTARQN